VPPSGRYESELALFARAWMRSLGRILERGAILVIDYGFPAREYFHPQRSMGTLACHYRHHVHADPFYLPGLQDVTAHVDFSALARAAAEAGLEVLGYANQAQFLVNCGITELLAREDPPTQSAICRPRLPCKSSSRPPRWASCSRSLRPARACRGC
jgi:SAM-dependent MidA family methyltransferase